MNFWSLKYSFPKNVSRQYQNRQPAWSTAGVYFWPTTALHAYFLQAHKNEELMVLGKLPYMPENKQ
jgi:hypothetical protein